MSALRSVFPLLGFAIVSCAVGPNFERPVVETPAVYRGAEEKAPEVVPLESDKAQSLADLPWWEIFEDPVLDDLLRSALEQNLDLEMALARTEQARQLVIATRSGLFPKLGYQGSGRRSKYPISLLGDSAQTFNSYLGMLSVAWEIDVWGRVRRATEAARAEMLAAEENQRAVLLSLVSRVATLYFELLELDREHGIAEEAVTAFQKTLGLFTRKYEGGVASKLAMTRAAAAEAQASAWVPLVKIQVAAVENQLSVLLGRPPDTIPRGAKLIEQSLPSIPPGLPSALLERRPDIRQAEQAVVAANAQVGVAVGNFLPRIGLTALYGGSSQDLSDLAKGSANVWSVAAEFAGPIFQSGMLIAEYHARVAIWHQSKAAYELTALEAFAEVSDALVAQEHLGEVRAARERQAAQLEESVRLSLLRYREGLASYFEVLEAQQDLYPALFDLAQARYDELKAVVDLYRALGGGWKLGMDWLPTAPDGSDESTEPSEPGAPDEAPEREPHAAPPAEVRE